MEWTQKQMTDTHLSAMIDRRVWFGFAAFLLTAGLLVLMERMGLPERLLVLSVPLISLLLLVPIGLASGSMRLSDFYAGGRHVPAFYVAPALTTMSLGLGFTLLVDNESSAISMDWLLDSVIGLTMGLMITSVFTGPLLRAIRAFSLMDLLTLRFPNPLLRFILALVTACIGFVMAWAALSIAIAIVSPGLNLSSRAISWILGGLMLLLLVPGGLRTLIWICAGGGLLALASLGLAFFTDLARIGPTEFMLFLDTSLFQKYSAGENDLKHFLSDHLISHIGVIASLAVGIACLGPIVSPSVASSSSTQARKGTLFGLIWVIGLIALLGFTALATHKSIVQRLEGQRPERLSTSLLTANGNSLISLCTDHSADPVTLLAQCRKRTGFTSVLRSEDIRIGSIWLLIGLAPSSELNPALSGLIVTSLGLLTLLVAGGSAFSCALALSQDLFKRQREGQALSSRRLALTRLGLAGTVLTIVLLQQQHMFDPKLLAGTGIALASLCLAPVTILIFWPRANSFDACVVIATSIGVALWPFTKTASWPELSVLLQQAITGAGIGLLAGMLTSFLHGTGPESRGAKFLQGLRTQNFYDGFADKGA